MNNVAIKVENLSKRYVINHEKGNGDDNLREVIIGNTKKIITSLNPFSKNSKEEASTTHEEFWALNDVSFEINQGDRVGIIGRNGAGKSTLLKVLSRITEPTKGKIHINGRIASLLEVGTGFHPELTGRENIYLNGAILGMSRAEIRAKFDEIVAFAEVAKFLDTPVKRYSSGMYVRLAFAVAAHLEPEILIVDEVLAVGDAAFQKKCLGKMQNVSDEGKTIVFVSHNMGAIRKLCNKIILLDSGSIEYIGDVESGIEKYLDEDKNNIAINEKAFAGTLSSKITFEKIIINEQINAIYILPKNNIRIDVYGKCKQKIPLFRTTISVYQDDIRIFTMHDTQNPEDLAIGNFKASIRIPPYLLRPGRYSIAIGGYRDGGSEWTYATDLSTFSIQEEWNEINELINIGIINIPYTGERYYV